MKPQVRDDPSDAPARPSWGQRLERTKLTPLVFVGFFALLAVMCGAAAVVGYTVQSLSHHAPR